MRHGLGRAGRRDMGSAGADDDRGRETAASLGRASAVGSLRGAAEGARSRGRAHVVQG